MIQYNMDPDKGGIKYDGDKTQWHLLPFESVEGAVRVLMHGAKKYSAFNWAKGMPYTRVLDATQRHLNAIYQGEDKDPESGLDHVDHAICELIFLKYYMLHGVGEDDRFKRHAPRTPEQQQVSKVLAESQRQYAKMLRKIIEDIPHEDAEGDPNYWGV
jgi:hypothetical protein